uniref:Gypsy retrotransposon integrase-like protein 1 n=1 Tax=Oryzias sinensis TaxID=183150 RepID=A0A8C8DZH6_9TELE
MSMTLSTNQAKAMVMRMHSADCCCQKPDRSMDVLDDTLLDTRQIKQWTSTDVLLSQVHEYILKGWPAKPDARLKPYQQRKMESSVRDGCMLWGARVVIPTKGRDKILKLLHQTHTGMSKMKGLARSYLWWPGMDESIEREVQLCEECQKHHKSPPAAPLHPWEWPETPWSRIHVDYTGPFLGEMFLLVVDAHSKWMDIYPVKSATSQITIEKPRQSFSVFGLPKMLVSDNGTCFTSAEFETFMKQNGIDHVRSPPFHPSSNGLAERAMQTFKEGMNKIQGDTLQTKLSRLLFSYRITPHATTGLSPAELMMSRRLGSAFDLLMPDVKTRVQKKQLKQKDQHHTKKTLRSFGSGNKVFIRNYSYGPKWIPAVVLDSSGPVSYNVSIGNGRTMKRHVDQVRARLQDTVPGEPEADRKLCEDGETVAVDDAHLCVDSTTQLSSDESRDPTPVTPPRVPPESPVAPVLRRSQRERHLPGHLKDFVR